MSGIELAVDLEGLADGQSVIASLGGVIPDLMDGVGALVESQTRRRLSEEKTAPDGEPWALRSPGYAQSLRPGTSILIRSGGLLDSLAYEARGNEVSVGSDLIYAAIHQHGGTADMAPGPAAIPARPFLGLSDENERELLEFLEFAVLEQVKGAGQ